MSFMIFQWLLAYGLYFFVVHGFSGSCILGTQSVGSVSWDLRHPSHETFRRLSRASRGAAEGGGKPDGPAAIWETPSTCGVVGLCG